MKNFIFSIVVISGNLGLYSCGYHPSRMQVDSANDMILQKSDPKQIIRERAERVKEAYAECLEFVHDKTPTEGTQEFPRPMYEGQ